MNYCAIVSFVAKLTILAKAIYLITGFNELYICPNVVLLKMESATWAVINIANLIC